MGYSCPTWGPPTGRDLTERTEGTDLRAIALGASFAPCCASAATAAAIAPAAYLLLSQSGDRPPVRAEN
jgi:hypothetical protein